MKHPFKYLLANVLNVEMNEIINFWKHEDKSHNKRLILFIFHPLIIFLKFFFDSLEAILNLVIYTITWIILIFMLPEMFIRNLKRKKEKE